MSFNTAKIINVYYKADRKPYDANGKPISYFGEDFIGGNESTEIRFYMPEGVDLGAVQCVVDVKRPDGEKKFDLLTKITTSTETYYRLVTNAWYNERVGKVTIAFKAYFGGVTIVDGVITATNGAIYVSDIFHIQIAYAPSSTEPVPPFDPTDITTFVNALSEKLNVNNGIFVIASALPENLSGYDGQWFLVKNNLNGEQGRLYYIESGLAQPVELELGKLKLTATGNGELTTNTGKINWNQPDGTATLGLYNNVNIGIGEDIFYYGKASANITKGQAVQFVGYQGDHILMKPAVPSEINANPRLMMGIANQSISSGDFGYVIHFGKITGFDSGSFGAGNLLYFASGGSINGALTATQPTAPNAKILMAAVIKAETSGSANNGVLQVRITFEPRLGELQDVQITNIQNNDVLKYNTATQQWENTNSLFLVDEEIQVIENRLDNVESDIANLDSELDLKADLSYVDDELALKANASDVTTSLSGKADLVGGKILINQLPNSVFDSLYFYDTLSGTATDSQLAVTFGSLVTSANNLNRSPIGYYYVITTAGTITNGPKDNGTTYINISSNHTEGSQLQTPVSATSNTGQLEIGDWVVVTSFSGNGTLLSPYLFTISPVNNTYELATTSINGITRLSSSTSTATTGNNVVTDGVLSGLVGNTSTTLGRGDYAKAGYDHSQIVTGNPHNTTASDVGAEPANANIQAHVTLTDGSNPHQTTFANIATKPTTLSGYGITDALTSSEISSTYLTQSNASSTYLTQANATSTYIPLTQKGAVNGVADLDAQGKIKVAQLPNSVFDSLYFYDTLSATASDSTIAGTFGSAVTSANNLNRSPIGYYFVITTAGTISSGPKDNGTTYINISSNHTEGSQLQIPISATANTGPLEVGDWIVITSFSGQGTLSSPYLFNISPVNNTYENATTAIDGIVRLGSQTTFQSLTGNNVVTEGQLKSLFNSGGNIGIGTTSPTSRLEIQGAGTTASGYTSAGNAGLKLDFGTSSNGIINLVGGGELGIYHSNSSGAFDVGVGFGTNADRILRFDTAGGERMRITSAGLVGIGTNNPGANLTVSGFATDGFKLINAEFLHTVAPNYGIRIAQTWNSSTGVNKNIEFLDNNVIEASIGTPGAGLKSLIFNTDGSERLRINSSGNVGIGTASPATKLDVKGNTVRFDGSGGGEIDVNFTTTDTGSVRLYFGGTTSPNKGRIIYSDNSDNFAFFTNSTERMRITSDGNVGVGTTSPDKKLTVNGDARLTGVGSGLYFDTTGADNSAWLKTSADFNFEMKNNRGEQNSVLITNNNIELKIGATPRLLINSTGNVGIGTTSPSTTLHVVKDGASAYVSEFTNQNASGRGIVSTVNSNDTTGRFFDGYSSSANETRIIIYSNGNIQNTNNSYGAFSDIKLKENIVNANPKLNELNKVRVVNYNLKGDKQKQIGVIAQELEQIFPGMVDEIQDTDKDGKPTGTTTKSVKYSVFVPMLIKAIQELKAEIDELKKK